MGGGGGGGAKNVSPNELYLHQGRKKVKCLRGEGGGKKLSLSPNELHLHQGRKKGECLHGWRRGGGAKSYHQTSCTFIRDVRKENVFMGGGGTKKSAVGGEKEIGRGKMYSE